MLPKNHRLTKTRDFDAVFKKGRGCYLQTLGVKCAPNHLAISRFGFIVPVKISKKATKRNYLKRQLREIIRLNIKSIKTSYDCAVLAREGILEKNYQELKTELEQALAKLRLL
ncbi:MAG: ribonuclease P protein component [Patescibacteria group bacterium]|nr:ribonuclease P protein component [Patescibacteria group bacterium]MDD5490939.1 ribonuclease P protein component [Patescibacteria group bacterium]